MEQGLINLFKEYKIWYNATKNRFTEAKKEFANFKALDYPTDEQIYKIVSTQDDLFHLNYMLMASWLSVNNIKANYPEDMIAEIDAYHLLNKRASWLVGEINKYVKSLNGEKENLV